MTCQKDCVSIIVNKTKRGGCMKSNHLKEIRKSKGITLSKLADLSGVSAGYLCHLEKGSRTNPSMEIMNKIAEALNKSITEIFF